MDKATHLFPQGEGEKERPLDASEVDTDLERRRKFLLYLNRGWLALGIVALVTLPFFPKLRSEFIVLIAVTVATFLIVRFLNLSGRTRLAGGVFTLIVNFTFYGLFLMLVGQLGADEAFRTGAPVSMLMGLAVVFAGAFVDKWAAPGLAAFDTVLLISTRLLIAPGSDPRPSALVLWWMLALTIWLYESTLDQALAQVLGELKVRQQAEAALRDSESSLKHAQQTAHVGNWAWDTQTNRVTMSDEMYRIFGLDAGSFSGDMDELVLHTTYPDDMAHVLPLFEKTILEETPTGIEYRVVHPDGAIRHVWTEPGDRVTDETGKILRLSGVVQDVTERKQAEQEVRRQADRVTALYETTRDLVLERDLSKLFQTIVERAVRLLDAGGGGLYLCEPALGQVRCVVSYNTPRDFTGTVLKYGEGAAGRVAQTAEPLIIEDYTAWEGPADIHENERPFTAVLSVPMKWQNEVIGVIHVLEFEKEHYFTTDDLNLMTSFANQAAIAAKNAQLYTLARRELAERTAAQAALLESEQRFRGLSEAAFEGILIHDKGIIQAANQALADLVGVASPEDLIGKNGLEALPLTSESRERLRANLSAGLTEPLQITVIRPDGSTYPAETQARDIIFKGRKLRVVAMRDVSARSRMEDALRESELRFSTIFRASPNAITVTSLADGQFTLVNDAFISMSGFAREDLIGRTTSEINMWADPDDRDRLFEILRQEGRIRDFEARLRTKSGEIRNVLMASELIELSGQTYIVSLGYDITERHQAEDARRESEKRYRSLFENMLEGYAYCKMLFVDNVPRDFVYLDVNPAFQALTGLKDVTGKWVSQVIPGIRETNPELLEIYGRVASTGVPERFETYVPALKIWFSISVFCPAKEYFVAVFGNITERKQFEEALQGVNAELERHVAQRTAQLETANKELEAFSYSVSHDLRAPLRAIDGYARILTQDFATQMPPEAQGYLRHIRDGSKRMDQLIQDLLLLSRVTRQTLKRVNVDLSGLARDISEDLKKTSPERHVEFVIEDGLHADGDPGLLTIVMENLLGNAWKFTSKRKRARIEFGSTLQPEGRTFFVRDNGAGFDMAYVDKLFGTFQRLHSETEFEGNGIGLATVQRIISRHSGRVWAEAKTNKGATFYFIL